MASTLWDKTKESNKTKQKGKKHRLKTNKKLPTFPKVRSSGKTVRIFWEDGRIEYWGDEDTNEGADKVAEEMQLELRASLYVKEKISKLISELEEDLVSFDVTPNIIGNAIQGGYLYTLVIINNLDELLSDRENSSLEF